LDALKSLSLESRKSNSISEILPDFYDTDHDEKKGAAANYSRRLSAESVKFFPTWTTFAFSWPKAPLISVIDWIGHVFRACLGQPIAARRIGTTM